MLLYDIRLGAEFISPQIAIVLKCHFDLVQIDNLVECLLHAKNGLLPVIHRWIKYIKTTTLMGFILLI